MKRPLARPTASIREGNEQVRFFSPKSTFSPTLMLTIAELRHLLMISTKKRRRLNCWIIAKRYIFVIFHPGNLTGESNGRIEIFCHVPNFPFTFSFSWPSSPSSTSLSSSDNLILKLIQINLDSISSLNIPRRYHRKALIY